MKMNETRYMLHHLIPFPQKTKRHPEIPVPVGPRRALTLPVQNLPMRVEAKVPQAQPEKER